jgi:trans-aconitate methyltransferase
MPSTEHTDYSHETYSTHAGFVPLLTSKVTALLSPTSSERIIDLGAGDLVLTSELSKHVSEILALDASSQLLKSGVELYPPSKYPNMSTKVLDCRYLERDDSICNGTWDAVFSNAALHWILCDPSTRSSVVKGAYKCLRPNGRFVAELGGFGNIAEIQMALTSALLVRGVPLKKIQNANPWCFPSEMYMNQLLKECGFEVEKMELEYRPTELSDEKDGEGGVKAWMQMFGDKYLTLVEESVRSAVAAEARDMLEGVSRREDGRWVAGYVRLRFVARKPE